MNIIEDTTVKGTKCYKSFSCILSVLIIIFVVASIGWDSFVSKPEMRKSIEEIRIEVKDIHQKIDKQYQADTLMMKTSSQPYEEYEDSIGTEDEK
jgi:hypothetical protein